MLCLQSDSIRHYRSISAALDPAGPLFDADDGGLAKTDAAFVDVIHTNGNTLGTLRALGHVDFYPNKGGVQPACKKLLHIGENY